MGYGDQETLTGYDGKYYGYTPLGAMDKMGGYGMDALKSMGPEKAKPLPDAGFTQNLGNSRQGMVNAIDPVKQWALTGNGPSAAQAQLQAGKDQSMAAAASQAKSAYGMTPGQQATLATNAGTQATQQAANQAAQLRAQEQQQAMSNYLAAVNAQRQGDIDVYKAYADQYGQVAMGNAQSANAFKGGLMQTAGGIIGGFL